MNDGFLDERFRRDDVNVRLPLEIADNRFFVR